MFEFEAFAVLKIRNWRTKQEQKQRFLWLCLARRKKRSQFTFVN